MLCNPQGVIEADDVTVEVGSRVAWRVRAS